MSRMTELRRALNWAKDRARYARRQLDRFEAAAGNSEAERRTRRKLEADVARARMTSSCSNTPWPNSPPELSNSEAEAFVEGLEVMEDA